MHRTLVLSVALAVAAVLVNGDESCVSEDAHVDQNLFQPIRDELQKSQSESINVTDYSIEAFGFGVQWTGAQAGNFGSLQLTPLTSLPSETSSSKLCTTVNGNVEERSLTVNLGFKDLHVNFGSFEVITPFINIGGHNSAVTLEGENLLITIKTTTTTTTAANSTATTCTAGLSQFEFTDWGTLQANFGEGLINSLLSKIFNSFFSGYVLNILTEFGVSKIINNYVTSYAETIINASGQQETVCTLINSLQM